MNVVEEIVRNEPLEDVLSVIALKFGIPSIDMTYSKYRKDVVLSGELFTVYQRLVSDGVLVSSGSWHAAKGPNWKEPAFVRDGKYSHLLMD
ncbi:immunity protein [Pseudomonas sp. 21LCFQ02]|uniref:immunity protein n=1 Tax=Pseudomonas sp. 21LCFQ02 TaxID=2957505 RepID=UPI00209AF4C4|nr:immunity protein [Pseudomonas sp. 21LCFQ02]MCO8167490.1 immunity protein [Pseudomonas sp. 21LCFQ02]